MGKKTKQKVRHRNRTDSGGTRHNSGSRLYDDKLDSPRIERGLDGSRDDYRRRDSDGTFGSTSKYDDYGDDFNELYL